jgi:hypothetical protein
MYTGSADPTDDVFAKAPQRIHTDVVRTSFKLSLALLSLRGNLLNSKATALTSMSPEELNT